MDVTASLVPGSEGAGGDVVTHAFGRTTEKGKLPVVNDAGAIGCQVREPAPFHHLVEQQLPAVLDEVRAVNQHDAGLAVQRCLDLLRAAVNRFHDRHRTRMWRFRGLNENFLEAALASAFGQRTNLQSFQVQRRGEVGHYRVRKSPVVSNGNTIPLTLTLSLRERE